MTAPFSVRPGRDARDGQVESLVMEALWSVEGELSAAQVGELATTGAPLPFGEVAGCLERLAGDGVLVAVRRHGVWWYRPMESRTAYDGRRMGAILAANADVEATLGHFVAGLGGQELDVLRDLLGRWRDEDDADSGGAGGDEAAGWAGAGEY